MIYYPALFIDPQNEFFNIKQNSPPVPAICENKCFSINIKSGLKCESPASSLKNESTECKDKRLLIIKYKNNETVSSVKTVRNFLTKGSCPPFYNSAFYRLPPSYFKAFPTSFFLSCFLGWLIHSSDIPNGAMLLRFFTYKTISLAVLKCFKQR